MPRPLNHAPSARGAGRLNRLWLLPHAIALLALALLSLRLAANFRFLRRARRIPNLDRAQLPRVSVLVPARDEARTIGACAASLLAQRYPALDIHALDDGSSDGTGAILDALAARDPRLSVHHTSGALPPGWNGKSYACQRLADRATGAWLLFTDADTVHEPDSVARGVSLAIGLGAPLLSVFPRQRVQTWSERVLVSFIMDFLPLIGVNFTALWRARPARAAANGQYLLARADIYRALGGHASVAGALVDDFALADRFHAAGYPVALVAGDDLLSCRMYHAASEVWGGFSKNLASALTRGASGAAREARLWQAPLFAAVYACVFVTPFISVTVPHERRERALAALEIAWLLLLRAAVVAHLRRPRAEIITTPLAAWGVMLLGTSALFRRALRLPIGWKGRTYASGCRR